MAKATLTLLQDGVKVHMDLKYDNGSHQGSEFTFPSESEASLAMNYAAITVVHACRK